MKKNFKRIVFFLLSIFSTAKAQETAVDVLASILMVIGEIICGYIIPAVNFILFPLCLVFLAISGIRILAAGGDLAKINREKERIMMIVTALFIIFAIRSFLIGAVNFLTRGSITGGIGVILFCMRQ